MALTPVLAGKKKLRKGRSAWWWVHHWLGLKLAIFMTFVLATGTLATLSNEIDWLIDPAQRVTPRGAPTASWGDWAAAVKAAEPEATIQYLSAPLDPWFAARVVIERPDGALRIAYVDPWTSEVRGVHGWFNVNRFLRNTHRHLMMPVAIGVPIVGSMALVLLVSMITGLVTYKKFWRGFTRPPQWRKGRQGEARRFTGDLHRFAGLWSIWFLAIIIVTGVWYVVEVFGGRAPPGPRPEIITGAAQPAGAALDALIVRAQAADPALRISGVSFPDDNGRGVLVAGQSRAILVRDRANAVWVDPRNGEVLLATRGEDLNLHQRISEAADPLHFGTFGGLATRLIWFVFGVVMTGLSVTGVMIYSLRMTRAESEGGPRHGIAGLWASFGPAAYPALGLILISIALTPGAVIAAAGG
ncbi:MAG: PepSY-associated TM helix domain-containing protein [Candidatus Brevundimonas colombiensis]|uniref:PepSY-associated TM helix domain-containing protein n=1 Tax=Candidatus Brevundimonas colombiensis TaxID=3121376 RepID=A0AAJ6BIY7_9CAUL|nr:PepSY-associated TM helix domain-containing protein [Brevundimonas sp.]WEK39305.1 MAG: PepSY-associated TM helix domain-containing protein [Brevundimonas sp.]